MNSKNKMIAFAAAGFFVLVGTYNAVVINSESHISNSGHIKRLDEMYGVVIPGRQVAGTAAWKKLPSVKASAQIANSEKAVESTPVEIIEAASVQEELSLSLVEVINAKKYQNGLAPSQFNGTLSTNNGIIENLSVSLPNGESVTVSFSEMTGNVFEYDMNGEIYSGMMYQVDQEAYMVTLTNGPLEGTRLRFSSQLPAEEQVDNQQILAESNVEVGSFGSEPASPESMVQNNPEIQVEAAQVQGFNFQNSQTL